MPNENAWALTPPPVSCPLCQFFYRRHGVTMSSETLGHCLHQIFGLYVKRFSRESAHRQIPYPRPLTWEGKSTVLQMMSSWTLFVILLITDPLSSLPLVQFETCPTQEFPLHVRYQVSVVWLHRTIALSPLRSTQALRGALGWGHPTTEKDRKTAILYNVHSML